MAPIDPVTALNAAAGRPILLQFASEDKFVPADIAAEITGAAGAAGETRTYQTGHEMDAQARTDRDAWLAHRLGFE
jgi:predicted esterase